MWGSETWVTPQVPGTPKALEQGLGGVPAQCLDQGLGSGVKEQGIRHPETCPCRASPVGHSAATGHATSPAATPVLPTRGDQWCLPKHSSSGCPPPARSCAPFPGSWTQPPPRGTTSMSPGNASSPMHTQNLATTSVFRASLLTLWFTQPSSAGEPPAKKTIGGAMWTAGTEGRSLCSAPALLHSSKIARSCQFHKFWGSLGTSPLLLWASWNVPSPIQPSEMPCSSSAWDLGTALFPPATTTLASLVGKARLETSLHLQRGAGDLSCHPRGGGSRERSIVKGRRNALGCASHQWEAKYLPGARLGKGGALVLPTLSSWQPPHPQEGQKSKSQKKGAARPALSPLYLLSFLAQFPRETGLTPLCHAAAVLCSVSPNQAAKVKHSVLPGARVYKVGASSHLQPHHHPTAPPCSTVPPMWLWGQLERLEPPSSASP